ncbi:MAG: lipoprotein NlpI [Chthoniobacter sp.]|jgi:lipoprotein NlpI|nr:lipoprotein NlpI [Chthoniobacter sp.]
MKLHPPQLSFLDRARAWHRQLWLCGSLLLCPGPVFQAWSAEANDSAFEAAVLTGLESDVETCNKALATKPDSLPLYSRRGDCHLFLGHAAKAIADFEKMIALDPAQDAPHWRLGIAYFFAGDFAKSARQFEKYHAYDGSDRENGIWKFLAQARQEGVEKARAGMLVYNRFDREPFPALYEMFAGKKTTAEVFSEIASKGLGNDDRVMFFANYYTGLNEDLLGHREKARELLRKALASPWGRTAEGGPTYMWQVARLHAERLKGEPAAP